MLIAAYQLWSLFKERNKRHSDEAKAREEVKRRREEWAAIALPLGLPVFDTQALESLDLVEEEEIERRPRGAPPGTQARVLAITDPEKRRKAQVAYGQLWEALRFLESERLDLYAWTAEAELKAHRLLNRVWNPPIVVVTILVGYWIGSLVEAALVGTVVAAPMALVGTAIAAVLAVINAYNRFVEGQEKAKRTIASWEQNRRHLAKVVKSRKRPFADHR